jgi:hypothetical protein
LQPLLQSAIALQGTGLLQFAARPYRALQMQNGPDGRQRQKHMMTKHILKTDFGVTAELELNEEIGDFNCVWDGTPPFGKWPKELVERVMKLYLPWRNEILADWQSERERKYS